MDTMTHNAPSDDLPVPTAPVIPAKRKSFDIMDWLWSWMPRSSKEAGDSIVTNLALHWFPNKVSIESLSVKYSFWLGTISAFLFLYLTVTGVVLMFLYVPSIERAYQSIKDLEFAISYGAFLRASHRIAAHLMVAVVFLHMVRVFLTGAYKNGVMARQFRPLNWWIGLILLLLTLFLSFTGYLLPWDQLAFWAITVGTNIARAIPYIGEGFRFFLLGGNNIDQNTLIRFYVLHCMFLPLILTGLFMWHMWRIRKDGGLACDDKLALSQKAKKVAPTVSKNYMLMGITSGRTAQVEASAIDEEKHQVNTTPVMLRRIWIVALLTYLAMSGLAVYLGSPLEEPANAMVTPNPAKAPWYFLWLQELVAITTFRSKAFTIDGGFMGGVIIPSMLLVWGFIQPFLDKTGPETTGVWFHKKRVLHNIIFIVVCILVLGLTYIGTFMRGPNWTLLWPWQAWPIEPPQL